jgi:hypothetical protein
VRFGAATHDEFNPDVIEVMGVFGGYAYLNVSVSRLMGVRTPGLTWEAIDYSLFGAQPGVPPYEPGPGDETIHRSVSSVMRHGGFIQLRGLNARSSQWIEMEPSALTIRSRVAIGRWAVRRPA